MDRSLTIGLVIGASISSTVGSAFKTLEQKYTSIGDKAQAIRMGQSLISDIRANTAALKMLEERAKYSAAAKARLSGEIDKTKLALGKAKIEAQRFGIDISNLEKESTKLGVALKKAEVQMGAMERRMQNRAVRQEMRGQIIETVGAVYALQRTFKEAINFESTMADVAKVVDFASEAEKKTWREY